MYKVPILGAKGEYLVAAAPALNMGYFAFHCNYLELWAVLWLSPLICAIFLLIFLTV